MWFTTSQDMHMKLMHSNAWNALNKCNRVFKLSTGLIARDKLCISQQGRKKSITPKFFSHTFFGTFWLYSVLCDKKWNIHQHYEPKKVNVSGLWI